MGDVDNGPYKYPPPPGPPPHGPYEYILVPPLPPVPPNASFFKAYGPYQQIEQEILFRMASADKLDFTDGTRSYRFLLLYVWRFDHDRLGCFIGRFPLPQFRFLLDDPALTRVPIGEWTPIA